MATPTVEEIIKEQLGLMQFELAVKAAQVMQLNERCQMLDKELTDLKGKGGDGKKANAGGSGPAGAAIDRGKRLRRVR